MYSDGNIKSIKRIYEDSGGYISANINLYKNLINSKITKIILKEATFGTPIIKIGAGNPKVMLVSGIHGNELPSQAASIHLINYLYEKDINGTIYIIPFASPESTMNNTRKYRNIDLNRSTSIENSITNIILKKAEELNITALGDFHSTGLNANPGREGVFSTSHPEFESFNIASFITKNMVSTHFKYKNAGTLFGGALEDESNLIGIPAVTCEVLSKNGFISGNSLRKSFLQMLNFLNYFNIV